MPAGRWCDDHHHHKDFLSWSSPISGHHKDFLSWSSPISGHHNDFLLWSSSIIRNFLSANMISNNLEPFLNVFTGSMGCGKCLALVFMCFHVFHESNELNITTRQHWKGSPVRPSMSIIRTFCYDHRPSVSIIRIFCYDHHPSVPSITILYHDHHSA